jgi:hypothetical protein
LNAGSPQAEMMLASQPGSPPSEPTLWAAASITAGDSDINGLTLTLREGPHITGVVAFDGSKERPQAARITASTVAFESADVAAFYSIARGRMTADGTFATAGLVPGRYFIRPAFSFPGWSVKSITANGRDALDDPIEVAATDLSGITITLTDRPIELSGTVRASGQPDRRARVVVFPSDRARWSVPTSGRRMVMTTVSRQGTFSFAGLPAGDYLVATMSDQADSNWQNPKVLEALAHDATLVSLRDGDHRTVDLTRNPGR